MLHHHVQNEEMLLIGRLLAEPQQALESPRNKIKSCEKVERHMHLISMIIKNYD